MTDRAQYDLTLEVSGIEIGTLSQLERKETIAWLASSAETAPAKVRPGLQMLLSLLTATRVNQKEFNTHARQLAIALGLIPSSERRRSGKPLAGFGSGAKRKPKGSHAAIEEELERADVRASRYGEWQQKQRAKIARLQEKLATLGSKDEKWPDLTH